MDNLKAEIDAAIEALKRISDELARDMAQCGGRLAVPWMSQLGDDAKYAPGDCGPACVGMVIKFCGPALEFDVDDVSAAMGKPPGFQFSSLPELAEAAGRFGVRMAVERGMSVDSICAEIAAGRPVIALVSYPLLPKRWDPNYQWGHYVVVVGCDAESVTYHDPYWTSDADGAFIQCERGAFARAFETPASGNTHARLALRVVE